MERAAFARSALHPDAAAHKLDKPGADCEAEARAPVLARGRAVGLSKGLEDEPLLFPRDADTRVGDGKVQDGLACLPRFDLRAHNDLAAFGELDRVTHQVDDNLAQAPRITHHPFRRVRSYATDQLEPLVVGAHSQWRDHLLHSLAQVELNLLEVEFPRLDLREVQDVVDHGQKGIGRPLHGVQILPLFVCNHSVQHEFRHAEQAVHGSADLMAHVGQEFALGAAGGFGGFLGLFEFPFGALALGDVTAVALHLHGLPVLVDQPGTDFNWNTAAILVDDLKLIGGCSPKGEFALGHLVGQIVAFGRHDLIHLHLERFLAAVADASLACSVQGGEISRQVVRIDNVIRILKQVAVAFLDDDFVLQPAQDDARLLVHAPFQREGPSRGHQDHDPHNPQSPQSARQRPEG